MGGEWKCHFNTGATSTGGIVYLRCSHLRNPNLVVTATDSDGLTDSDQVNTINGLPTAPVVSINPVRRQHRMGSTSYRYTVYRSRSHSNVYLWWQLGGQAQTLYTSSSLRVQRHQREQWTVVVTNDGIADGVQELPCSHGKYPPTISTVSISPTGTVYNDGVLTCLGMLLTRMRLLVSYEWSIGGTVQAIGSTLDLSSTGVMPGATVVCTATATDGDGATDSDSTSASIGNRSQPVTASISTNGTSRMLS